MTRHEIEFHFAVLEMILIIDINFCHLTNKDRLIEILYQDISDQKYHPHHLIDLAMAKSNVKLNLFSHFKHIIFRERAREAKSKLYVSHIRGLSLN